jgi:hypothetical protein
VRKEEVKGRSRIRRRNRTKEATSKKMKNGTKEEREGVIKQASAFTMRKVLRDKTTECVI